MDLKSKITISQGTNYKFVSTYHFEKNNVKETPKQINNNNNYYNIFINKLTKFIHVLRNPEVQGCFYEGTPIMPILV